MRFVVVCYNDPERSYNAAGRAQATLCRAGDNVEQSEWVSLDADALLLAGTDDQIVWGSQSEGALAGRAPGDELVLRVEKRPGAYQSLVREVQVWGIPERLAVRAQMPGRGIACTVAGNTYSSLRATWDDATPEGGYARVRYRPVGSEDWETACFSQSPGLVLGLRPATEYEVATELVGTLLTGDRPEAAPKTQRLGLPGPLEIRTMADSFGMNFYPGGGGAHQAHVDETAVTQRMIHMLAAAGVRHVRWWAYSPGGAQMFAEAGLAQFPSANFATPEQYAQFVRDTGAWLVATANEPDFNNVLAGDFVKQHLAGHAAARAYDSSLLVAGPTT
jgi:hypothetical protein